MMKINYSEITNYLTKPPIYEKGNAFMWTDPHIQPFLLEAHINLENDIASRNKKSIEKTVLWMKSLFMNQSSLDVLDLGCGPGLYIENFYKPNHHIVGIDMSENSLNYAKKHTKGVTFIQANYLEIDLNQTFDLIYMIYCDFGVLSIDEQNQLMHIAKKHLKKGGLFIIDGYNLKFFYHIKAHRSWDMESFGFWSHQPHLVLNETFIYQEEDAFLEQHIVFEEQQTIPKIYRFYNHIYSLKKMKLLFNHHQFSEITCYHHIIDDDTVDFYIFKK